MHNYMLFVVYLLCCYLLLPQPVSMTSSQPSGAGMSMGVMQPAMAGQVRLGAVASSVH